MKGTETLPYHTHPNRVTALLHIIKSIMRYRNPVFFFKKKELSSSGGWTEIKEPVWITGEAPKEKLGPSEHRDSPSHSISVDKIESRVCSCHSGDVATILLEQGKDGACPQRIFLWESRLQFHQVILILLGHVSWPGNLLLIHFF